jgi:hypothetical protein
MQDSIIRHLQAAAQPIRLKKLRQAVMNEHPGSSEEELKAKFADELDQVCNSGFVSVTDGMVTLLRAPAESRKRARVEDMATASSASETSAMSEAIMSNFDGNHPEPTRQKKLRNAVFESFKDTDEEKFKEEFAAAFDSLCASGHIVYDSGMVTFLKSLPSNPSRAAHTTNKSAKLASSAATHVDRADVGGFQMWRDGEKAWKDGTLDHEYLASNPDGITRVFCGNLSLNITEEQLRAAVDGITYIKVF